MPRSCQMFWRSRSWCSETPGLISCRPFVSPLVPIWVCFQRTLVFSFLAWIPLLTSLIGIIRVTLMPFTPNQVIYTFVKTHQTLKMYIF